MKTLLTLTLVTFIASCTPSIAKDNGRTYNSNREYTTKTYPNYQSPKTNWNEKAGNKSCVSVPDTNFFTKETRMVVKCY